MAKAIAPLFPKGIGCLKYKSHKNPKNDFTHTVSIDKHKKKKGGEMTCTHPVYNK